MSGRGIDFYFDDSEINKIRESHKKINDEDENSKEEQKDHYCTSYNPASQYK